MYIFVFFKREYKLVRFFIVVVAQPAGNQLGHSLEQLCADCVASSALVFEPLAESGIKSWVVGVRILDNSTTKSLSLGWVGVGVLVAVAKGVIPGTFRNSVIPCEILG